jgi:anti-anti-sigma factor
MGTPFVSGLRSRQSGIELSVAGDVDLVSAADFEQALGAAMARADGHVVTIDLSGVTFMDSCGARTLLRTISDGRTSEVVLRDPSRAVRLVLDILAPGSLHASGG